MVSVEKWKVWGSVVEVDVTEAAALSEAAALIAGVIDEAESVCDIHRGDAEIHAVNLSQGAPVKVSRRMSALLRSALWVARMTDGAVNPISSESADDDLVPTVHPTPSFLDIQIDDDVVFAPWGASFEITGTAKADTVDRAAELVARELECGAAVRIGDVIATAGHCPAGGWQISVPGDGEIELVNGMAMATAFALAATEPPAVTESRTATEWEAVTVIADDALWAYAVGVAALAREIGAIRWIEQHELRARLVDRSGRVYTTENW
ncbi:FAD:protein FMN transferase [Rhodococcus marinonascens]|uniref:FAD:protein FMN transferase n=1 Tax=Rhodococcus marinonascens TaxID=38311 RepID=UPI0009329478|nr:FAD:protein FMN transferase [Rhodococcus marinonascens]